MKTSKIVIGLATMLCVAVLAAHPASAGFFDPPNNPYPSSGPYYNPYQPTAPINCAKIAPEVREYARGCAPVKQLRKKGTR